MGLEASAANAANKTKLLTAPFGLLGGAVNSFIGGNSLGSALESLSSGSSGSSPGTVFSGGTPNFTTLPIISSAMGNGF
jgi:hypothetical protein